MHSKIVISFITASIIACSVFSSAALGADLTAEKLKLMQAAGETLPVNPKEQSTKISRDKALAIAKTVLEDESLYANRDIMLRPNYMFAGSIWAVNFSLKQSMSGNVSVDVDSETGEIISFNSWNGNDGKRNFVAKMTKEEAAIKANEYIKNVLKDDLSNYEYQIDDIQRSYGNYNGVKQPVIYYFNYMKKTNGIPFSNDTINLGVDGTSGKVTNYRKNIAQIDQSKFPTKDGIISEEAALTKYKEAYNVVLQYVASYPDKPYEGTKPNVRLTYYPISNSNLIDAFTGKSINYDGSELNIDLKAKKELIENPEPMKKDAKLETKIYTEEQANAVSEEVKSKIEKMLSISFDKNNMRSYGYFGGNENVWNYNWDKRNGNSNIGVNLGFNKENGHIANLSLHRYDNYDYGVEGGENKKIVVNEKFSWQQSKDKALELIKTLIPEQYGFFVDENLAQNKLSDEQMKYQKSYNFQFTRLVNNLRFSNNAINVNINRETGEIDNFSFTWNDFEFPAAKALITKESAQKTSLEGVTAKLVYSLNQVIHKNGIPTHGEVPRLVYSFTNEKYPIMYRAMTVDASTGKLIDFRGKALEEQTVNTTTQASEVWAKRSIELLTAQGIYSKNVFEKNEGLNRFDAIKLLSLAKGVNNYGPMMPNESIKPTFSDVNKENEYFSSVENAVVQNIIEKSSAPLKGSEIVTKGEFAKLLINLIGYSDIAKFNDIFKADGVINVSQEQIGYVALCKALDILPMTPGGNFDGSKAVTTYEAAFALYKALSYIK